MKILLVTEKFDPTLTERDGGARLVNSLLSSLGDSVKVMQFGMMCDSQADWQFDYPAVTNDRFQNRILNANFISNEVRKVSVEFDIIIFIHISMLFGFSKSHINRNYKTITFPMFMSVSYEFSGEVIPNHYKKLEMLALQQSDLILTPSHFEKRQLITHYRVDENLIRVLPRGVSYSNDFQTKRTYSGTLKCCSVGSIKPQKNTLELILLFADIKDKVQNSSLDLIGPVQNTQYYTEVTKLIDRLGLGSSVKFHGYVKPENIASTLQYFHLHLSTSLCETFGRSIFETLALGIPNIARYSNNAAADYLSQLPYAHFVSDNAEAVDAVLKVLENYDVCSDMSAEIGLLYTDSFLSRLLAAEILEENILAISDFDGTLFHKNDAEKTKKSINNFCQFQKRIVCTARGINDIKDQLLSMNLTVDWIIAYSGAIIADGNGCIVMVNSLNQNQISYLSQFGPESNLIYYENSALQLCLSVSNSDPQIGFRQENYGEYSFISDWKSSKLHSIIKLLQHINYSGRVRVFGDGEYDREMRTFFDGKMAIN